MAVKGRWSSSITSRTPKAAARRSRLTHAISRAISASRGDENSLSKAETERDGARARGEDDRRQHPRQEHWVFYDGAERQRERRAPRRVLGGVGQAPLSNHSVGGEWRPALATYAPIRARSWIALKPRSAPGSNGSPSTTSTPTTLTRTSSSAAYAMTGAIS